MERDAQTPAEEADVVLQSQARVTSAKFGRAPLGVLTLHNDRLTFENAGRVELDAPLSELKNVRSPWWTLGSAVHFDYRGKRWVCDFGRLSGSVMTAPARSGTPAGEVLGLAGAALTVVDAQRARKLGQVWKAVLDDKLAGAARAT